MKEIIASSFGKDYELTGTPVSQYDWEAHNHVYEIEGNLVYRIRNYNESFYEVPEEMMGRYPEE